MDLDRTSMGERAHDLRAQKGPQQERTAQPAEAPKPVEPQHGGPLAASQADKQRQLDRDPNLEARRRVRVSPFRVVGDASRSARRDERRGLARAEALLEDARRGRPRKERGGG